MLPVPPGSKRRRNALMMDDTEVRDVVWRNCAWSGCATLQSAMDAYPDLQVYLAGGVVRNAFLSCAIASKDFDLFFGGPSVEGALELWKLSGSMDFGPFGSARWYPARKEKAYCDLIRIDRFVNGLWPCEDMVDVLNQFDFTGNAVALDLRSGQFLDPQNGRRDLARRILRAVRFDYPDEAIVIGHPLTRNEVLWFRLIHYATMLELKIEHVTLHWLRRNKGYHAKQSLFAEHFFEPHLELAGLGICDERP
ncbi:MAG: hypothetical protein QM775_28100 [Pirellulales bacterium]